MMSVTTLEEARTRLTFKTGNLLDATEDYIGHGANCMNIMGAGVAKAVRNKWPRAFDCDREFYHRCRREGKDQLGQFSAVKIGDKTIVNLYTQRWLGADARAVEVFHSITTLFHSEEEGGTSTVAIAIPRIGCGIGGLLWKDVEKQLLIALTFFPHCSIVVYDLER